MNFAIEIPGGAIEFREYSIVHTHSDFNSNSEHSRFSTKRSGIQLQHKTSAVWPECGIGCVKMRIQTAPGIKETDCPAQEILPVVGHVHAEVVQLVALARCSEE